MLIINNDDVQKVLTVEDTLRVLEEGHAELARRELVARPRVDTYTETASPGFFHRWGTMEGSSKGLHRHAIRMKSDVVSWRSHAGSWIEDKYCVQPGLFCGLVFLLDTDSGEPLAFITDGYLQHLRVGALAALGAKYLAKARATTVGMFGAGGMARSHLKAFAAVRAISRVQVYAPTREHVLEYAREMEAEIGAQVIPCATPEEAARGADILAACTNSVVPIVFARMLEPGMHLTQVSGELDLDVLPRLDVAIGGDPPSQIYQGIPVDDSHGFTTYLAGNLEALQEAIAGGRQPRPTDSFRGRAAPLVDLIAGTVQGRLRDDEISASNGAVRGGGKQGLQFVTVASLVYDRAKQAGLGREIPTDWFLQDIRD